MREITHQNLDDFCCTCLVELTEDSSLMLDRYSIQENSIEQLINLCASMPMMEGIQLPKFVCGICFEKLQSFKEFCYQTMQSLSILTNIVKKVNKASRKTQRPVNDCGENEHAKLDVSEIKVKEEFTDDSTVHSNLTNSQEILHNEIKVKEEFTDDSTVHINLTNSLEILHNTSEFAVTPEIKIEICEEEFEQETPISDIKIEPQECVDMFYLCKTRNMQNDEDFPTNISSNPPSSTYDSADHMAHEQLTLLNAMKETYEGRRSYRCNECTQRFSSLKNFEAHMRKHAGLKPFLCEECGKGFSRVERIRCHVQEVHAPKLPVYNCPHDGCGRVFNRKDTCRRHVSKKHNSIHQKPQRKTLGQALWNTLFSA